MNIQQPPMTLIINGQERAVHAEAGRRPLIHLKGKW